MTSEPNEMSPQGLLGPWAHLGLKAHEGLINKRGQEKKGEAQEEKRKEKKERKKGKKREGGKRSPLFHPSSFLLLFFSLFSIALLSLSRTSHSSVNDFDPAWLLDCEIDEHSRRLSYRDMLARPTLKHGPAAAVCYCAFAKIEVGNSNPPNILFIS